MLEQLTELVKQFGQNEVVQNNEIPNEHNQGVLAEAASSIFSGLQGSLAQGGLPQLMNLFNGNHDTNSLASNPITGMITGMFANNIMKKFGIQNSVAKSIAIALIPMILSKLFSKAKDPAVQGFDAGSILDSLTGGAMKQQSGDNGGGLMDMLSKLGSNVGLDRNHDGHVDLNDLVAKSSTAAQQAQEKQGGSIMDAIGGLLGGLK